MMLIGNLVLHHCGARMVDNVDTSIDPTTEEEFQQLTYESPTPITWEQYQAAIPIVLNKVGMNILRSIRNRKLSETDWICTTDNVATIENIDEIYAYRQALRDITEKQIIWKSIPNQLDLEAMGFPVLPKLIRKSSAQPNSGT